MERYDYIRCRRHCSSKVGAKRLSNENEYIHVRPTAPSYATFVVYRIVQLVFKYSNQARYKKYKLSLLNRPKLLAHFEELVHYLWLCSAG